MYLFDSICYIQLTPEMGIDKFEMKDGKIRREKSAVENGDGGRSVKFKEYVIF